MKRPTRLTKPEWRLISITDQHMPADGAEVSEVRQPELGAVMRDRYVVFSDGRRTFVRDLTDAEIGETLGMIDQLEPMDGTDASHKDMRDRLILEQQMRAMGAR